MLKVSAFILLLATLGFLTETVQMPFVMARMAEKPACCEGMQCKGDGASADGRRNAEGQHSKDGKHGQDGKCNPDGSCNNTANCSNCPLCYMGTMVGYHSMTVGYTLSSTHYPVLSAGKLADYHSRSWKPPNAGPSLPDRI